jgi:hypothetical protein
MFSDNDTFAVYLSLGEAKGLFEQLTRLIVNVPQLTRAKRFALYPDVMELYRLLDKAPREAK